MANLYEPGDAHVRGVVEAEGGFTIRGVPLSGPGPLATVWSNANVVVPSGNAATVLAFNNLEPPTVPGAFFTPANVQEDGSFDPILLLIAPSSGLYLVAGAVQWATDVAHPGGECFSAVSRAPGGAINLSTDLWFASSDVIMDQTAGITNSILPFTGVYSLEEGDGLYMWGTSISGCNCAIWYFQVARLGS